MNYDDLSSLPNFSPMDVVAVLKQKERGEINGTFQLKNSPGRNIYEEFTTRKEAIILFDKLLWDSWYAEILWDSLLKIDLNKDQMRIKNKIILI